MAILHDQVEFLFLFILKHAVILWCVRVLERSVSFGLSEAGVSLGLFIFFGIVHAVDVLDYFEAELLASLLD